MHTVLLLAASSRCFFPDFSRPQGTHRDGAHASQRLIYCHLTQDFTPMCVLDRTQALLEGCLVLFEDKEVPRSSECVKRSLSARAHPSRRRDSAALTQAPHRLLRAHCTTQKHVRINTVAVALYTPHLHMNGAVKTEKPFGDGGFSQDLALPALLGCAWREPT